MKAAKAWCVAGLVLTAGFASASCGKDEGTGDGDNGGSGSVLGGTGGLMGRSGASARGGSAGSGTIPEFGNTKLGRGCIDDQECEDSKAPGLVCIKETDTDLGGGAPPKGLCTAPCTADADCSELGEGSLCFPFGDGGEAYCVEGCAFGAPGFGGAKCHNRDEFACNPALLGATDEPCTSNAQCGIGELCIAADQNNPGAGQVCAIVVPACLPACRGDIDCADGLYCDASFLSGVCVEKKPTGKALGEACTVKDEPDDCLGFCQADETGKTAGHCAQTCALGVQCAWNTSARVYDGVCLYASVLTQDTGAAGDFGFCTPSCNCTEECGDPALGCAVEPTLGRLNSDFRGPGLCFTADPNIKELDECTGAGGVPNAGGGGAPTGSEGGAGGAGGAAGG